ncbi:MAG: ABC transporter ATP-binding protein [Lachnospiraceae bacterium]|nr:ABC transporter ATP-binding protein [Lachnospiraceae bacterium]
MIVFDNVCFSYKKGEQSLSNINLKVDDGEVVLVCGPSGCGKSTLVRCVNGLIPHFYEGELKGQITVNDIDVSKSTLRQLSKKVGTVFQNPRSQFFNVDTTSELAFGCENFGMPPEDIEESINHVVNKHDMSALMDRSIFKLSGGEKQKIACASIAVEPIDVIILDEPSANLDYKGICELQKMIEAWKDEGKTILIAEHRISYLFPYITRALLMEKGSVKKEFTSEEIRSLSKEELHDLGLRADDAKDPTKELDKSKTVTINKQTGISCEDSDKTGADEGYFVLKNMKYSYRGEKTVFDIPEIKIPKGEIIAIVGENGAGKSTFLRCLCGMERRCRAKLNKDGKELNNRKRRQNIYMVMQDVNHQLFTNSVIEEVMISQDKEDKDEALRILDSLDLKEFADRHPLSLSGGQKQRVAVASAIASGRDIILFDEPTSGLDYYHMLQVSEILKKLKEKGRTVIIVTHDSELIEKACTKSFILQK